MSTKTIFISILLLSALTAATAGLGIWKEQRRNIEGHSSTPSATSEYQRLLQRYRLTIDSLGSVAGTIRIYDKERGNAIKETRSFRYIRSGKGYYMQLSYMQTFCDGEWVVQLDTVNRQISVGKASPDAVSPMLPAEAIFTDTAHFRTTGEVSEDVGGRQLRVVSDIDPAIRSSTLFYDTVGYQLRRADIEWWKSGVIPDGKSDKIWLMKIEYSYPQNKNMAVHERIKNIVAIRDGQITAAPAYRDYSLNVNNN